MRRRDGSNTFVGLETFITTGAQVRYACPKSHWLRKAPTCSGCDQRFHLFRWRHNCRVCGDMICGECSWTVYLVNAKSNVGRACYACSRASSVAEAPRKSTKVAEPVVKRPTCPSFLDSLRATEWMDSERPLGSYRGKSSACVMCKKSFVGGDAVVSLPCHDVFHKHCIGAHLALHDQCPTCAHALPRDMAYIRSFFTFKAPYVPPP
ncbi:hypothetical protein SPRG_09047 [Saprolegnia parasitica CBS 223.65]|uniref:FYVE-type domain-containing protein n=1 Tax=Saprolegnia parasitica (strain CBS 223.65) TaxID=695850 RepID=A0A067C5H5_SAPPC|nr:hypothetical protein SPRG_09047 [Saprolegnia parasitica CBS 223.65]KDO25748.1 hypothetical protein SPRG_09047 [Saprolegnia parasitica CBS 223.65]|eukprot:XP_012203557.1 hypothetical protein SPRG_09047 [Saprolegnia parasitica CBS 223.65]